MSTKVPGVNSANIPADDATELGIHGEIGPDQKGESQPGFSPTTASKPKTKAPADKEAPGSSPTSMMSNYRVRVERFIIDNMGDEISPLESLLSRCMDPADKTVYMVERKETFTKEGDFIVIVIYLEQKEV